MGGRAVQVLRSNGENEARAYAEVEVRPSPPERDIEVERVAIVDPRHTSTVRRGARRAGAGPRNPEQDAWPARKPPSVDLPDGRPATKAQRVMIDPELAARWRAEAKMKESA
jgi:hypothetical protein